MKKISYAILVALFPMIVLAQSSLKGFVVANKTNEKLVGANILLEVNGHKTSTSINGSFSIDVPKKGDYQIEVSYIGYQTKKLTIKSDEVNILVLDSKDILTDEVWVSATRANHNAATTLKNLDKQSLEKNNFGQDLPYLLNQTPSAVVYSDAGAGIGYTGLRIRGSDATRINVTINGIPYNDTESQGTYWVNLPDFASSVDNIQIQRGVGSSTNGAGAFGASLNIQTNTKQDSAYTELNNSVGSYKSLKNTLKVGTGLINGKWSFDGRLSRIVSDGYIDRASSNLKSYYVSGAYYGKNSLLRLNVFSGLEKTYQAWNGVPESKLLTDRRFNEFTYDNQTDNYQQDHYQLLYSKTISPKIIFNGALHYTKGAGYYEEYKPNQPFSKYNLTPIVIENKVIDTTNLIRRLWLDNDFYGLTYSIHYEANKRWNFVLGGAYNEYDGNHFGEIIWAQYAANSSIRQKFNENNGFKTDFNTFYKASFHVKKFNIFADLQYRHINYSFLGFNNQLENVTQTDALNFFNPKFGFTYEFNNEMNIYSSFSVANKEPNRNDYTQSTPTSRPKSERLNNLEIGYRFANERVKAGINLFGMWYKNQLVLNGKINEVGEYVRTNVDKSYRNGLELDATINLTPSLSWSGTSALSENKVKGFTEFLDDYDMGGQVINTYTKTDIAFSPNFVASSTLNFVPFKNAGLAFMSKYVSKQFMDNTSNNHRKLDAFFVNDVRLSYDFKLKGIKNLGVGLQINNVFNELYASNGYTFSYLYGGLTTENFYYPQAETNVMFSLNLKF